jgi:hypothetical protein
MKWQPYSRVDDVPGSGVAGRSLVSEAYLHSVSTRKVDDLVSALRADTGISKSEVSRIGADLDAESARTDSLAGSTGDPVRVPRRDLLQGTRYAQVRLAGEVDACRPAGDGGFKRSSQRLAFRGRTVAAAWLRPG